MAYSELHKDSDTLIEFSAGCEIFHEEDEGDTMYVVVKGIVDISLRGKHLGEATPGEIVGEMALLKSTQRSATAKAKTDCLLDPIDKNRFKELIQISPSFALYVMNVLAERLRIANEILAAPAEPGD